MLLDPGWCRPPPVSFHRPGDRQPYALTTMHMTEHWLTMGRKQVDAAISNLAPLYRKRQMARLSAHAIQAYYPIFREKHGSNAKLSGEFDPTVLMAAR